MFHAILLLTITTLCLHVGAGATESEVTLPTGKVQGYVKQSPKGRDYHAFEGIPYGLPPVGKLRFEEPKPMKPWNGVWQAKATTTCLQYFQYAPEGHDKIRGDEDCLHVNVYTPNLKPDTLKDVIVYIHGGAFMFNSGGTYGEKFLMDKNVIYVSFNYRLGPFGFLSTESRTVPGNMGLKDQKLALRWIKENIRNFGGNPDSITLTGMSAGGCSVHIHTLSSNPNIQLFNKVIVQSGTALSPWTLTEKARDNAVKLAELLGCPADDTHDMIKCIKYRPARQVVATVPYFQPVSYSPVCPFGPVIDKWSEEPILPRHPYKLLKSKQVINVPIIFSNVGAEGLYPGAEFASDDRLAALDEVFDKYMPGTLEYKHTVAEKDIPKVTQQVREFYFKDEKLSMQNYQQLIRMFGDRLFYADNERATRLHAAANSKNSFMYLYSYKSANSKQMAKTKSKTSYGASHADDTVMVLSSDVDVTSTESDREMSEVMQNLWVTFAKTSVPKVGNAKWEAITPNNELINYIHIKSPTEIEMEAVEYMGNRKNFWDTLPINENQNINFGKDEL